MPQKLKWKVADAPTGRYRSFELRGWPTASFGDKPAFRLTCEDEYNPRNVSSGDHREITILVADWRGDQLGGAFTWRKLKQRAATLPEAKQLAAKFAEENPEVFKSPTPVVKSLELFTADGSRIGLFDFELAAKIMNLNPKELRGFIEKDGYCLHDDPNVIEARLPKEK